MPLPGTDVAIPTVVPSVQLVGALVCGPRTVKVMEPPALSVGEPARTPLIELAAIATPAVPVAGATTVRLADCGVVVSVGVVELAESVVGGWWSTRCWSVRSVVVVGQGAVVVGSVVVVVVVGSVVVVVVVVVVGSVVVVVVGSVVVVVVGSVVVVVVGSVGVVRSVVVVGQAAVVVGPVVVVGSVVVVVVG